MRIRLHPLRRTRTRILLPAAFPLLLAATALACAGAPPRSAESAGRAEPTEPARPSPSVMDGAEAGRAVMKLPALRPFSDLRAWSLVESFTYRLANTRDSVVIPSGFVTDFASIPKLAQSIISALGSHGLPAILHDYLYWEQACARNQADVLFRKAMEEMGVGPTTAGVMYRAVELGGSSAWRENADARAAGLTRIIPADQVRPFNVGETWQEYREFLRDQAGVVPPPPAPIPDAICALGGAPRTEKGSGKS